MAAQAFAEDDPGLDDDMEIPPEIAASLVHRLLDGQYRRTLDEPVPMLGGLTPVPPLLEKTPARRSRAG